MARERDTEFAPRERRSRRMRRNRRIQLRLLVVFAGALLLCAAAYILSTVPPTPDSLYPKCSFHSMTGLHCPGCGATRAAHASLQGHFLAALRYNAFAVVFIPIGLLFLARFAIRWALCVPDPADFGPSIGWCYALLVAILVFSIVRNIPVAPFTELAPQELEPNAAQTIRE
jgi:hypothetical protein